MCSFPALPAARLLARPTCSLAVRRRGSPPRPSGSPSTSSPPNPLCARPPSRRPVDPPIILQVHAVDSRRTDDHPLEFLESVSFFTRAHLVAVEPVAGETVTKDRVPDEVMHAGGDWWKRVKGPKGGEPIAGEELVGGEKMADPEGRSPSLPARSPRVTARRR